MYVGAECRECKAACETLIFGGCVQKICRLKMWSDYSLEVVDAVARNGSFTGAAQSCIAFPRLSAIRCASWKRGWRSRCSSGAIATWSSRLPERGF